MLVIPAQAGIQLQACLVFAERFISFSAAAEP